MVSVERLTQNRVFGGLEERAEPGPGEGSVLAFSVVGSCRAMGVIRVTIRVLIGKWETQRTAARPPMQRGRSRPQRGGCDAAPESGRQAIESGRTRL